MKWGCKTLGKKDSRSESVHALVDFRSDGMWDTYANAPLCEEKTVNMGSRCSHSSFYVVKTDRIKDRPRVSMNI